MITFNRQLNDIKRLIIQHSHKCNAKRYVFSVSGLVMISSLMIVTSLAMFTFPKQLRGNRIPAPHQIESIDAHKPTPKTDQPEEDVQAPRMKGPIDFRRILFS